MSNYVINNVYKLKVLCIKFYMQASIYLMCNYIRNDQELEMQTFAREDGRTNLEEMHEHNSLCL
jgi:hypothetical protein